MVEWLTPDSPAAAARGSVRRAGGRSSAVVGAVLLAVGGSAVVGALTGLEWFDDRLGPSRFAQISAIIDRATATGYSPGVVAEWYFSWLAWVLLALLALAVAAARFSSRRTALLKVGGVFVAVVTATITTAALTLFDYDGRVTSSGPAVVLSREQTQMLRDGASFSAFWRSTGVGFWAALLGLLAIGVGVVLLPPRSAEGVV